MKVFADTNVLAYLFDPGEPEKQKQARHLLEVHQFQLVISTQVLIEFYSVCVGKLRLSPVDVTSIVRDLSYLNVVGADKRGVGKAVDIAVEHNLSIFDGMIAESALRSKCDLLLTEDSGLLEAGLPIKVENPFA